MSPSHAPILFVNPRMSRPDGARLPLSLLHLAAALEPDRPWRIVDGNVDPDPVRTALSTLADQPHALVGVSVMPGPQVPTAIQISAAIRARHPSVPIVWGGYFPTLYTEAAINAPYVDYVARGQGEQTLLELLGCIADAGPPSPFDSATDGAPLANIAGLTWKQAGRAVHNRERAVAPPTDFRPLPYERLDDVATFLRPSFMGSRTAVHQAALGCRYRCGFCGVVSMWNGKTVLDEPARVVEALLLLRDRWGANAVQFYDHNFFDREETSISLVEGLATVGLPWWCYARADTLAGFSASTWEKLRRGKLRMAYIGAETASDEVLRRMHKGARVNHTLEVAIRCREYGIIPEFSFVLGGPEDPEGEIEKTFVFVRRLKEVNPECEIVLYFYSPTPQRVPAREESLSGVSPGAGGGPRLPVLRTYGPSGPLLPTTPEEWAEPRWIRWACHQDAPWLTPQIRRRVADFGRVLGCRFPTMQDYRTPRWGKLVLRGLASWRYARQHYDRPWELALASRLIPLRDPKSQGL
jgi:anaerobic magnesium-protoporphyrin IX monomethyl ester cyclase